MAIESPPKSLFDRELLVVGGKGGAGRTTVAAALGLAAARRGKRVLIVQTNGKDRLARLLGARDIGPEIVQTGERLWAVNTNPRAALREYGLMVLRFETVYRAVFENRTVRQLLRAVPGLDDYAMLGKTWYHTTEGRETGTPRFDLVLLDGPATGHLLTMLRIPQAILAAVPEGPLTKSARSLNDLLVDPARAALVLVTLAEEMPTSEALELAAAARGPLRLHVPALVVNALWPDTFGGRFAAQTPPARALDALLAPRDGTVAAAGEPPLGPLVRRARTTRSRRELNERYLERLVREVAAPATARLPMLFARAWGGEEAAALSGLLEQQLAGQAV